MEEDGHLLSLVLDREEKRRVAKRRIELQLERSGVRLPPVLSDLDWMRLAANDS